MQQLDPIIRVPKVNLNSVPSYRDTITECHRMHPLEIESDQWILVWVNRFRFNVFELDKFNADSEFTKYLCDITMRDKRTRWAVENSFDGLYFQRRQRSLDEVTIKIGVYLKEEHATYWTLKYGYTK
jgi:hypothetical protein